jgi:4'-phosphopantetheinyl transferase
VDDNTQPIELWTAEAASGLAGEWSWTLPEEALRRLELRRPIERDRRIVHAALRRTVLAARMNCAIGQVSLSINERGQLVLPGCDIPMSASHHDDVTVLAIGQRGPIGVDLEPEFEPDWDAAVEAVLTDREHAALRSLPTGSQASAYFACWTLKEAVMKALSEGLSDRDPRTIEVTVPPEPPELLALDGSAPRSRWTLRTVSPTAGYLASLAVPAARGIELRSYRWPMDLPPQAC